MHNKTTWFLVADGARAQIYATEGRSIDLKPVFDHDFAAPTRAPGRAMNTDRPGRAFDSAGQGRHAMEPPTDWQTHEKQMFVKSLTAELEKGAESNAYDRLVLVASPEILGYLRDDIGKNAGRLVVAEINKDLTHLDALRLSEHLRGEVKLD